MYKEHFGLKEMPFSIAPDPRYLYMSDQHREALAHLVYGISSDGGFVLLTGEVGTGKTTVCRCLLGQLPPNSDVAFVLNPKMTSEELLATVCDELGIKYPAGNTSVKVFVDGINSYLLDAHARGRKTMLIIEEAQNLSPAVLEQVRLLTNLETSERKLLQIIMLGQPELRDMLARSELRQLSQRVTARYHLGPLSKREMAAYISHRLAVAGMHGRLFNSSTMNEIFRLSGGIPRIINLLCDRSLLGAYAQGESSVDRATLRKAAREVFGVSVLEGQGPYLKWAALVILCMIFVAALSAAYHSQVSSYSEMSRPAEVKQPEKPRLGDLQWPDDKPLESSRGMALQALLSQWGIKDYLPGGKNSACTLARSRGLLCLNAMGNLDTLTREDRPAVLKLADEKGREYFVAVTSLRSGIATVEIGSETRNVNVREITTRWQGNYLVLWQAPPNYKGKVRQGDSGPEVEWLEKQLAALNGRQPRAADDLVFDSLMSKELKRFQFERGLFTDGIAGPHTLIQLNSAAGGSGPRLKDKRGAS